MTPAVAAVHPDASAVDAAPWLNSSLTPDRVDALASDDLQTAVADLRARQVYDRTAAGGDERASFERVLVERGERVALPEVDGPSVAIAGVVYALDPVYTRALVEAMVVGTVPKTLDEALADLQLFVAERRGAAGYSAVAGVPEPGAVRPEDDEAIDLANQIRALFERTCDEVGGEQARVVDDFLEHARRLGIAVLDASADRVSAAMRDYGVRHETWTEHVDLRDRTQIRHHARSSFSDDASSVAARAELMSVARVLAGAERQMRRERRRAAEVRTRLAQARALDEQPAGLGLVAAAGLELDLEGHATRDVVDDVSPEAWAAVAPGTGDATSYDEQVAAGFDERLRDLEARHAMMVAAATATHPILASYTAGARIDLDGLAGVGAELDAAAMWDDLSTKLGNIDQVRRRLEADPEFAFQLGPLLTLTRGDLQITPGTLAAAAIDSATVDAQRRAAADETWHGLAITGVTLLLAGLAAIPTGGSSIVAGAAAIGQLGGIALDLYLLRDTFQQFRFQSALVDTDFDRARELSADEPSLFWLAASVVGTVASLGAATTAFRELAQLRRTAVAARRLDELQAARAELQQVAARQGLGPGVARRLDVQILLEHPDRALIESLGHVDLDGVVRSADDVAAAMGRQLTDLVGADDVARLSEEVGLPVVATTERSAFVQVRFDLTAGGVLRPRALVLGAEATLGDALAHRTTIELMGRIEAATAGLAAERGRLVLRLVDDRGVVRHLPPGSPAAVAWLEAQKYPGLIAGRASRLERGVGLAERELLEEDLRFFESELAYQRAVVDQVVEETAPDFVARAAKSNRKAIDEFGYPSRVPVRGAMVDIDAVGSPYYYVDQTGSGGAFILRKHLDAMDVPSLRVVKTDAGFQFVEGELTRHQEARLLIGSWAPEQQAAYATIEEQARQRLGSQLDQVVPLAGVAQTKRTFGAIMGVGQVEELTELLERGLARRLGSTQAKVTAERAMNDLLTHEITVIRGTDQLRAFGYRSLYASTTGGDAIGDLHHWIPLYLGGDHRVANLLDLDPTMHRELHQLIESFELELPQGPVRLSPNSIARAMLGFEAGIAIITKDGRVWVETLSSRLVSTP